LTNSSSLRELQQLDRGDAAIFPFSMITRGCARSGEMDPLERVGDDENILLAAHGI